MNRITKCFATASHKILNVYFTAGYPRLNDTAPIIEALASAGADMVEVGMPYSDPLADGPTIQSSGAKALKNGMLLDILFKQVHSVRNKVDIPIILMGYYNQMMQFGEERFLNTAAESGVDGLIIPDLPVEVYKAKYIDIFQSLQLGISFLITPQSPSKRILEIDKLSSAFIYQVANASITGAKKGITDAQIQYFENIQKMSLESHRLIGFGISNGAAFNTASKYADGAIIGSAFIKHLEQEGSSPESIQAFIKNIRTNAPLVKANV